MTYTYVQSWQKLLGKRYLSF